MTGTFDDWAKSVKLEKKGEGYEKLVELSLSDEKILYKVRNNLIFFPLSPYPSQASTYAAVVRSIDRLLHESGWQRCQVYLMVTPSPQAESLGRCGPWRLDSPLPGA